MLPVFLADELSIIEIPGLSRHIEQALKYGKIVDSSKRIADATVYAIPAHIIRERNDVYFCSPKPGLAIICGSVEQLGAMVEAGRGEQPSFVGSEAYSDLIGSAGESPHWTVQNFDTTSHAREEFYLEQDEDQARIDAEERRRRFMPMLSFTHHDYLEEEYRCSSGIVFRDEEAIEEWYKMWEKWSNEPPSPNVDKPKLPEELEQYYKKMAARDQRRREGNRLITETVYTAKNLAEQKRMNKKRAEFYRKLREEERQAEKKQKDKR